MSGNSCSYGGYQDGHCLMS